VVNPVDFLGWVWPVPIWDGRIPRVSDGWGSKREGGARNHKGVDIMFPKRAGDPAGKVPGLASKSFIVPLGTPVIAAGPGKIWSTGHSERGYSVQIDHGRVGSAGGVVSFYQHLGSLARPWKRGDVVRPGDVLGFVGFSAIDSEKLPHLHFELWFPKGPQSEWARNPGPYLAHFAKIRLQSEVA